VLKQTSPTATPVGAEAVAFDHRAVGEHEVPDLIPDGNRFSDKIVLESK
jgi:hypothetical protein